MYRLIQSTCTTGDDHRLAARHKRPSDVTSLNEPVVRRVLARPFFISNGSRSIAHPLYVSFGRRLINLPVVRAFKAATAFNEPPDNRDDHDATNQNDRPVHTRSIHALAYWPEQEEAREECVDDRKL